MIFAPGSKPAAAGGAAASRPSGSVAAWIGVAVCGLFVLMLAVALAVICHPPFADHLPSPIRAVLYPLTRLGNSAYSAVSEHVTDKRHRGFAQKTRDLEEDDDEEEEGVVANGGGRMAPPPTNEPEEDPFDAAASPK